MRIALLCPAETVARLAGEARRHGHEVVATSEAQAVLAWSAAGYLDASVIAACDSAGIRVVAIVGDDAGRRLVASLGLFESVDAAADWPTIERALLGPAHDLPARTPTRGQVIAVWGPAGSPGRTTLAIGIAAELAARGLSVALADVDTHGASVAPTLGMLDEAPGFAAACRLASTDSLSTSEFERIGQRYESRAGGFWVLTGIGRPSRWPELSGERVARTIRACRSWVDVTVLDTGASLENDEEISSDLYAPRRNAATITAVHEADAIVAVGAAEPVGLSRFLRAHADLLEAATTDRVRVVMNRVRASAIGLGPEGQVRRTLSRFAAIDDPVIVPHDQSALDGAVLSGRTLVDSAPRSKAREAIRALAAEYD